MILKCDDLVMAERIQTVYDEKVATVEDVTGWNDWGRITVYCPSDSCEYNYRYNKLLGAITTERVDLSEGWEDWQLEHELGHASMTALYNWRHDCLPGIGEEDDSRDLWKSTTRGFAFREGWASYFQTIGKESAILDAIRPPFDPTVAGEVAACLYHVSDKRRLFSYIEENHPQDMVQFLVGYSGLLAVMLSKLWVE